MGIEDSLFRDRASKVLENKCIDGGTASPVHWIKLPSGSTSTLAALERRAGSVAYDTDLSSLVVDDGSGFETIGLSPDENGNLTLEAPNLFLRTEDVDSADSSGDITITSGDNAGVGNTGGVIIDTGSVSGGDQGKIQIRGNTLASASAGDVLTLVDQATGEVAWSAPPGSYVKYSFDYTAFSDPGLTKSVVLFELPARTVVISTIVYIPTAFAAAGIADASLSIGTQASPGLFGGAGASALLNGHGPTEASGYFDSPYAGVAHMQNNLDVLVKLDADVALNTLTAGAIEIYMKTETLPA